MKKLFLFLLIPIFCSAQIKEFPLTKKPYLYPMGYLEHIPSWVTPCTKKPPILIFLHGIGEGSNYKPLSGVAGTGLPALLKACKMPVDSFIVLCPQGPKFISVPALHAFIQYAKKTYLQGDTSRIYLTGLSGGAITGISYVKLYKAKAGVFIAGSGSTKYVCDSTIMTQTPVWLFHGDADTTVPCAGSTNLYKAVHPCYFPMSNLRITIYAGVNHNGAWDRTYNLSGMRTGKIEHNFGTSYKKDIRPVDQYDIDIYSWLLQYK